MPAADQPSRTHAWLRVFAAIAVFYVLVAVGSALVQRLFAGYGLSGVRQQVTLLLTGSVAGQAATMLVLILYLRSQKRSLADIGFGRPSSVHGWIATVALTALFVGLMLSGRFAAKPLSRR